MSPEWPGANQSYNAFPSRHWGGRGEDRDRNEDWLGLRDVSDGCASPSESTSSCLTCAHLSLWKTRMIREDPQYDCYTFSTVPPPPFFPPSSICLSLWDSEREGGRVDGWGKTDQNPYMGRCLRFCPPLVFLVCQDSVTSFASNGNVGFSVSFACGVIILKSPVLNWAFLQERDCIPSTSSVKDVLSVWFLPPCISKTLFVSRLGLIRLLRAAVGGPVHFSWLVCPLLGPGKIK